MSIDFGSLLDLVGGAVGTVDSAHSVFERLKRQTEERKLPPDVAETIIGLSSQLATAQVELARLETEIMKIQRAYEAAEKLEQRKRNYVQAKTPMGEIVYRLKDDADTGELPHNACPHCFQEDKIRILQLRGAFLKCDACKTIYRNTESSGVAVTRHNRGHPFRGF